MRRWLIIAVAAGLCGALCGCAQSLPYSGWAEQLSKWNLQKGGTAEDVSRLVGAPPARCEPMEALPPSIGIVCDRGKKPVAVTFVRPEGPAYRAGIRAGDIIKAVGGEPVADPASAQAVFEKHLKGGQAFSIETNRGAVSVTPVRPKAERCTWEVKPFRGAVAQDKSSASSGRSSRGRSSGGQGGAGYTDSGPERRFFRTTCRIIDGQVAGCESNWTD